MFDTFGWGDWITGCLAALVIVAAIAAVRYLLLQAEGNDHGRFQSGGTS